MHDSKEFSDAYLRTVLLTPKGISEDAMPDRIKGNEPTGIAIILLGTREVVAESEGA